MRGKVSEKRQIDRQKDRQIEREREREREREKREEMQKVKQGMVRQGQKTHTKRRETFEREIQRDKKGSDWN